GVAAPPSLPIARVSLARTLALKASISASSGGASAIGAGSADSTAANPVRFGESNSKFGMSLAMLMKNACNTGAGPRRPPMFLYYTTRRLMSSQPPDTKPVPKRRSPLVIPPSRQMRAPPQRGGPLAVQPTIVRHLIYQAGFR